MPVANHYPRTPKVPEKRLVGGGGYGLPPALGGPRPLPKLQTFPGTAPRRAPATISALAQAKAVEGKGGVASPLVVTSPDTEAAYLYAIDVTRYVYAYTGPASVFLGAVEWGWRFTFTGVDGVLADLFQPSEAQLAVTMVEDSLSLLQPVDNEAQLLIYRGNQLLGR